MVTLYQPSALSFIVTKYSLSNYLDRALYTYIFSGLVPISVSTMTGLPRAEARLSPRVLFILLTVLVMVISEVVARVSLPPPSPGTQAQGIIKNFIPFRGLNCFVVGFMVLTTGWHIAVLSYCSLLQETSSEAGVLSAKTAGWIPPLLMFFMLLNNRKARSFTRRKMARWLTLGALPPDLGQVQAQVPFQAEASAPDPTLAQVPLPAMGESPNGATDQDTESTGYTGWAESKIILVQEANVCL